MTWKDINAFGKLMQKTNNSGPVIDMDMPAFDERLISMATSEEPKTFTKEEVFSQLANDQLFEKAEQLKNNLFNGTLAVQGGLGMGFQAFDEHYSDKSFALFLEKYDLSSRK